MERSKTGGGGTRLRSKDMLGRVVGGFRIESLVGKGSSGVVFRAVQESIERPVALKILTSKWASDPTNLARFRREAISAARISHPNVVSVIDYGESSGLFYMAMTYIEGQSLSAILKSQSAIPLPHVSRIGFQMGTALAAIDQVGLIHRDIKPANIMIASRDSGAYLTDLGLAKATDNSQDITLKGFTVGTPNYIAPEQALAEEELTIACDIYSLGATLYHAATGKLLFQRSNAFQVMKAHVKEKPKDPREINPQLPPQMAGLLLAMVEKAPVNRPHPTEVATIFGEVLESLTGMKSLGSSNISASTSERIALYTDGKRAKSSAPATEARATRSKTTKNVKSQSKKTSKKSKRSKVQKLTKTHKKPKSEGRVVQRENIEESASSPLVPILLTIALLLALVTVLLLLFQP
ncbi:MAG: serine/threonine-protein kinase [Planctomycetota bacterium]|nr:serine/threonine-protein kinase [Planctomycetota bacterium]